MLPSEAAISEISPGGSITVSKYRSLQAFVSAVKQGCSPPGDVTGEADVSLRLVSFLEETRRRTWLGMRTVLSGYTVLSLHDHSSNQSAPWCSALLVASENLQWPMPVDYAAASIEHRTTFEDAFRLLLDFQLM